MKATAVKSLKPKCYEASNLLLWNIKIMTSILRFYSLQITIIAKISGIRKNRVCPSFKRFNTAFSFI